MDHDVPPFCGDPHRLQQVLWNVLSNALKFTRADGLITVALRRANDSAEIQMADTGVGIRPTCSRSSSMFPSGGFVDDPQPWGAGSRARDRSAPRRAPRRNRCSGYPGEAGGRRSRFGFRSTSVLGGAGAHRDGPPPLDRGLSAAPCVARVLVVEDHDDARELVASVLGAAGAEVTSTASAEEALERIARATPDLLSADLGLPAKTATAASARARMNTRRRFTAGVALTAYTRPSDRERELAAGFLRYIIKPVDPADSSRSWYRCSRRAADGCPQRNRVGTKAAPGPLGQTTAAWASGSRSM